MIRKFVAITFMTIAAGLVIASVLTTLFPSCASFGEGRAAMYHFTACNGNLRVVQMIAEFHSSYLGETPLDENARSWNDAPTEAFGWRSQTRTANDDTPVHELVISLSLPTLLPFVLAAAFVMYHAGHLKRAFGEVIRPSAPPKRRSPAVRTIRAAFLGTAALGACAFGLLWVASSGSVLPNYLRKFDWGSLHADRRGFVLAMASTHDGRSLRSVRLRRGHCSYTHRYRIQKATPLSTWSHGLPGFSWRQEERVLFPMLCGVAMSGDMFRLLAETKPVRHNIEFPLWAPLLACGLWPAFAFYLGPWRRSGWRDRGCCLACGYDLTGNVSGTCPECGTPRAISSPPPTQSWSRTTTRDAARL